MCLYSQLHIYWIKMATQNISVDDCNVLCIGHRTAYQWTSEKKTRLSADADKLSRRVYRPDKVTKHSTIRYVRYGFLLESLRRWPDQVTKCLCFELRDYVDDGRCVTCECFLTKVSAHIDHENFQHNNKFIHYWKVKTRNSAVADKPRDTFRGQSRSPNIVPFHMLGIQIFDFEKCRDLEIQVKGHSSEPTRIDPPPMTS